MTDKGGINTAGCGYGYEIAALPLSPQSSVTLSVLKIFVPSTVSTPSFIEAVHPISLNHADCRLDVI